jgi:nucleoside phosphorylase
MLIWICALHCEAKPVIDFHRLKKDRGMQGFDLYRGQDTACVVSGIGMTNMAAACGWAAAILENEDRCWINLGVAGHRSLDIGTPVLVNKISRESGDRSIYPVPLLRAPFISAQVISQDGERNDYHQDALYDMEAWAFASVVERFDTLEACQCVKVVSDNQDNKLTRDKARISALIDTQFEAISTYARNYALTR